MANDLVVQGAEWAALKEQGGILLKSGFLPKHIKDENQLLTIMLMGRELEVSPMIALTNISVINGKPCIEAKLMLALVFRKYPTAHYRMVESSSTRAVIELGRPGQKPSIFTWTIQDAKTAGLTSKDTWNKYPTDMLMARVISRAVRQMYPEVVLNAPYTPEEMETVTVQPIPPTPAYVPAAAVLAAAGDQPNPCPSPFVMDLTERKAELLAQAAELSAKVDFTEKFGMSIETLIEKMRTTESVAALDKVESKLVDIEMDLK